MQLVALKDQKKIWAHEAKRGEILTCPTCGYAVRRRGGYLMRAHFYHLYTGPKCQGSNKSLQHYQTQMWISKLLHKQGVKIEHAFPKIDRIADIYWPSQQIVFEVQYSPISFKEMLERNRDYSSIGVYPVWILHNKIFEPTAALEKHLEKIPHYFTNINAQGQGFIFDQFHTGEALTSPYIVNLSCPAPLRSKPPHLPKELTSRYRNSAYYFEGDLLDQSRRTPYFIPKTDPKKKSYSHRFLNYLIRTYNEG